MVNILFICHGNICRSTMAEFYMKHIVYPIFCMQLSMIRFLILIYPHTL